MQSWHAGDEYGHTRNGNNNWYGHDNEMTHFDWDPSTEQADFFAYTAALINFRKQCPLLGRDEFLAPDEITWHETNWDNAESKFLAFTLHGKKYDYGDLYCAINAHSSNVMVDLPPPQSGHKWCRLSDTNLGPERVWVEGGNKGVEPAYTVTGRSCVLLVSKPDA